MVTPVSNPGSSSQGYSRSNSNSSRPAPSRSGFGSRPSGGSSYSRPDSQRSGGGGFRSGGYNNRPRNYSRGGGQQSSVRINQLVKKVVIKTEAEVFVPQNKFADFQIMDALKRTIASKGYINPTPIQDEAIPHILNGKDLVGIANTGTGKSAAFLIPLINKVALDKHQRVIIIAPTRELAIQIDQEFRSFSQGMDLFSVTCIGGTSMHEQFKRFQRSHNFVIGTPGRLKDLSNRGVLKLNQYQSVVLDEVDRMLDMGFINDIKFLLSKLPEKRHSLFFSATITREIETLITTFAKDFVKISVKTGDTSDNIDQDVIKVATTAEKFSKLKALLSSGDVEKAILFVRTKHGADRLNKNLFDEGFRVNAIHGDKRQNQRLKVITDFKKGLINFLVATDVAARGLDIPNVSHVINYDLPATHDDYIHRIGRTGRANNIGKALTFIEA